MSLPHLQPGEAVNLIHGDERFPREKTYALVKTEEFEVIRMVVEKGKEIPTHQVPGSITIQCLAGDISVEAGGKSNQLRPGDWLYLSGGQDHSLSAAQDSQLLVTILFLKD